MDLQPDAIAKLQSYVLSVDNLRKAHAEAASQVSVAKDTARRLEERVRELNETIAGIAARGIKPDKKRLMALFIGAEVAQPDAAEIEARAVETRSAEAQRQQTSVDLAAVHDHLAELRDQETEAKRSLAAAELLLLTKMGDAYTEAFKRDAIEFVRSSVPPLHALANAIAVKTGTTPEWWGLISSILRIHWHKPGTHAPELVNVWPRVDGTLVSGETISSFGGVDGMISGLREAK